jgi:tetratricopeptide (TPR) repeat protein
LGLVIVESSDSLQETGRFFEALEELNKSLVLLEKSNAIAETFETRAAVAIVLLKLGKFKQNRSKDCQSSINYYQKSLEMFEKAKEKDRLSPTNNALYSEAKKMNESSNCD